MGFNRTGEHMDGTIHIADDAGEIAISYAELCKYHGRDFFGGVALAYKMLKLSFTKLSPGEIPHRNDIRIVVGFDPPGVMDAIEFVTRAVTRRRLTVDPHPAKGPDSVFGRYCFEVHYMGKGIRLWLKDGMLPEPFTPLARKAFAGIASTDELAQWKAYKKQIGKNLMALQPEEILDFEGPFVYSGG